MARAIVWRSSGLSRSHGTAALMLLALVVAGCSAKKSGLGSATDAAAGAAEGGSGSSDLRSPLLDAAGIAPDAAIAGDTGPAPGPSDGGAPLDGPPGGADDGGSLPPDADPDPGDAPGAEAPAAGADAQTPADDAGAPDLAPPVFVDASIDQVVEDAPAAPIDAAADASAVADAPADVAPDLAADAPLPPDVAPPCVAPGAACGSNGACCSNLCDLQSGTCKSVVDKCSAVGVACSAATDCCSLSCVAGKCGATQCLADNQPCQSAGACCSGVCSGTCQPLNASCKTAGNPCGAPTECCSRLCQNGTCALGASYCIQTGDVCNRATDCCTGFCSIAAGATSGTCQELPTTGSSGCTQDGIVCSGCTNCCSRVCAPYPVSGVNICQPAGGCRVTANLCQQDSDCCGGDPASGSAGAGNVQCNLSPGVSPPLGTCANPNGCDVEGAVCGLMTGNNACGNSRHDCCDCLPPKINCCKPDRLGVPRCYGGSTQTCPTGYTGQRPCCIEANNRCAFSAECCDGKPCVPDASGVLRCSGSTCVPSGGGCTANADCCVGLLCNIIPGASTGTCGTSTGTPTCALYGQSCSTSVPCCDNVTCLDSDTFTTCTAGNTNCHCILP